MDHQPSTRRARWRDRGRHFARPARADVLAEDLAAGDDPVPAELDDLVEAWGPDVRAREASQVAASPPPGQAPASGTAGANGPKAGDAPGAVGAEPAVVGPGGAVRTAVPEVAEEAGEEGVQGSDPQPGGLPAPAVARARPRPLVRPVRAPAPRHSTRRRCTSWELAGVALIGLGCALALFHQAWQHPFSSQVGANGDAEEYSWFFSWVPFAIGHGLNPLVSHYVGYPNGVNMMWNTSVLLPAFLLSPLTLIWGAAFSYNVVLTLAPALNVLFGYWAFRRWAGRLPALAGALVFGFSPYMVSQSVGHLAQTLIFSAPLMMVLADRLLVVQRGRAWLDGLLLGLLAWAQLLTGEEVLAMEAVTALVALAVLCLVGRAQVRDHLRRARTGIVVAAGVAVVLSAPFLAYQYLGPDRVQNPHPGNAYVSDLLNFVVPTNITKLAPPSALAVSSHFTGNGSEQGAYIGLPLLAFIVLAVVVGRRRRVTWVAAGTAVGAALLSMGPTLHVDGHVTKFPLPDKALQALPVFHNLLPDRFAAMMTFGVGWLVALGLEAVGRAHRWPTGAKVVSWLAVCTGLAALFPITNYPAAASPLYAAFDTGFSCPPRGTPAPSGLPPVVLMLPADNELALRWQAEAHFCFVMPSDKGMTGSSRATSGPPTALFNLGNNNVALPPLTLATRHAVASQMQSLGVSELVVAPEAPAVPTWTPDGQAKLVVWVEWLLGQAPLQSPGPYISYSWKHLPSFADIASGHVGTVPGEA